MSTSIIPVINIQNLHDARTLRALDSACRNVGTFQIVGHGLPALAQVNLIAAMHAFFNLGREQKQAVVRNERNHWGYYDRELTKNRIDLKEVYDYGRSFLAQDGNNALTPQWPHELPIFPAAVAEYFSVCEQLSFQLLSAIAHNLGVAAASLRQYFENHNSSFLRLNHYPVHASRDESALGIHPHTDAGALTVLLQDKQSGLEVFAQDNWHLVEPIDGALVINLGDIVQVWSNDRYQATLHRVRASCRRQRYSAAFFLNPSFDTVYQPLPSILDTNNVAKYHAIHWRAFREARAMGDYRDAGHEIQISDFRI